MIWITEVFHLEHSGGQNKEHNHRDDQEYQRMSSHQSSKFPKHLLQVVVKNVV